MEPPEEWRPVVTHPGRYEVSDRGRVRVVAREIRRGFATVRLAPRVLRFALGGRTGDYLRVRLHAPRRHAYVHHLVCEAWHGPRPADGYVVCHVDDCRENNTPGNLYWGTADDNELDRYARRWIAENPDAEAAPF